MGKRIEIIGQKFGKLTVISEESKNKHTYCICQCECGNIHKAEKYHLMKGHIIKCVPCGQDSRPRGVRHAQFKGTGEISGDFFYNHIYRNAKCYKSPGVKNKRFKEITIDTEYLWNLFLEQNKRCVYTGLELYFPKKSKGEYTASLDRVDSSKGYIPGNVQWVHKHINMMKGKYSSEHFIQMCTKVSNYINGKCEINT